MSDPDGSGLDGAEPASRGDRATWLWIGALILTAGAAAALILSDDVRLLRLGLVAALWAALIGAFGVARLRSTVRAHEDHADRLQRMHELALEREASTRQEFEARRQAEAQQWEPSRHEILELQAELRTVRETLQKIVGSGGLAAHQGQQLRPESPRRRPLDAARSLPRTGGQWPAVAGDVEPNTQVIDRVAGEPHGSEPSRARMRPRYPSSPVRPAQSLAYSASWHGAIPGAGQADGRPGYQPPGGAPAAAPHAHRPGAEASGRAAQDSPQPPSDDAGAHAEGTSVTELLAVHGYATDPGRRRRRRQ